jgi:CheY-like chemotaxis protein
MPRHILVADDSATIQRVVQITFAREDVRLTQTRSVDEALAAARRDRPDAVLADASLEGKNGYDLCAALKNDAQLKGVPVILMTGQMVPWDENKGQKAGVDAHVQKPFETQVLLDRVNEAIAKAPPRPATSAAPPPLQKPAPAPAPAPAPPKPAPAPSPASSLFAKPAPLPNPPPGLGRPPLIGGGKLSRAAAAATAAKPVPAPTNDSLKRPAPTMLGMPAQPANRVATPVTPLKPSPSPRPAPPPAVKAAVSERVAEKVAQFAASGPEYAAIAKLSREIIEQIVWEVVPDLAEAIIRAELDRLVHERDKNR